MPYNREIIASIAFEHDPVHSKRLSKENATNESAADPHDNQDNAGNLGPQQNEATRNIISCMKWALAQSITSISHPAKQRPLNPKKDFTIETKIEVKVRNNQGPGLSCCGASGVKRSRAPAFSIRESGDDIMDVEESDDESENDTDSLPVSFTFIDYSPMCYHHIREFFKIDPRAYCDVLMRSRWHSTPTPGKSAAQLFFCGKDWVIKTMTNEESEFLRSILHRYYFFVLDNPYTLLPHFVGHHRLEIEGEKINIIIMQNVFATGNTIHEKYDLKGSTVGRFATEAEKMKHTCTQKDLDLNRPIHVGPARRALLIDQIKKDCDFLRRSNVMDYSFLVGIHVLPTHNHRWMGNTQSGGKDGFQGTLPFHALALDGTIAGVFSEQQMNATTSMYGVTQPEVAIDGRCFTSDQGGMLSTEQPGTQREIYYIGIIDILQEYNVRKRLETLVIGSLKDREKISSVPPREYASRFLSFMSSIIA
ncbi:putative phosphatidylinositol-4-phosphate 5-kinase-like [Trypanosoma theileri]|uniref:Putative phosphatidylinositol-4-phosphate 5-kinase-like n=1 Tax=Trypanosoma theileri TaxID=67003 RepID=A0A1X0PB79_9TRYP|nr:putative phosphatidylinositol-4-phosphate 5-kinase-like [Trypanosoma theileri]ORC93710.1 putative phosphatidylinositol-4-phosphate 5-kinase-like [Trypanosoma theileri]